MSGRYNADAARGAPVNTSRLPIAGKKSLCMLVGALFALPAAAQLSDTLHPFVAVAVNYDDNLLRRDMTLAPSQEYSDTYKTTMFGISVERPIGRQVLTASAKVSKVSFNRFSDLDYTGKDGAADLAWHLGGHWFGHVGGRYSEALASFSDFHSSDLNLRTDKTAYANAYWQFHPSWQVHAGYNREVFHFDLASQSYNNRTENTSDAGFDYLEKNGSTFGLLLRRIEGTYPAGPGGVTVFDNGYQQSEANINIVWIASSVTQVTFVGGWARRSHNAGSLRDSSGGHGRLIASWAPLGHVQFTGQLWREFQAAEGALINTAMATGESLNINWSPTVKIGVYSQLQNEKRDFKPLTGVSNVTGLSDTVRTATLGVNYAVWRQATLGMSVFSSRRNGSKAAFTNDYRAKGIAFNASIKF